MLVLVIQQLHLILNYIYKDKDLICNVDLFCKNK